MKTNSNSLESKWIALHAHFHGSLALLAVIRVQTVFAVTSRAELASGKTVAVELQALRFCAIAWALGFVESSAAVSERIS